MIRNGSSGSASGSVCATSATAASCASDSELATITVGGANETSTASANSCSFDPKYLFTIIAVTPASLAISRTPTPS